MFLFGFVLTAVGGYLLMDRVTVHGGYWHWFGSHQSSFGVTLIPLLIGIGMLFYNGKSVIGWFLTLGGLAVLFAGILANLRIHFQATSLFNTMVMLVLIMAGLGLMLRALRPMERPAALARKPS